MPACVHCGRESSLVTGNCDHCHRPLVEPPAVDKLDEEIQALLASGRKLDAVRRFKDAFNVSLAEAKQAIDQLEASPLPIAPGPLASSDTENIAELVKQGKKLEAIKRYREQMQCSLLEAKQRVEDMERRLGVVPPKSSCALQVVVWLVILSSLAAGAYALLR